MTLLRGHFAWTWWWERRRQLGRWRLTSASWRAMGWWSACFRSPMKHPSATGPAVLRRECARADRVGIVAAITGAIASYGGNITDLQTRLGGGLYVVVAEADFPSYADPEKLTAALTAVGQSVGVTCRSNLRTWMCCDRTRRGSSRWVHPAGDHRPPIRFCPRYVRRSTRPIH